MFKINESNTSFEEEEALQLCLGENNTINFSEFDQSFEHIFIVKNSTMLEKRSIHAINEVEMSINLKESGDSTKGSTVA